MQKQSSLKRNTIYNLTGSILPMAISIVTVPLYLRLVGDDRYGILTIVWLLLGYFGVFDFGLSRATANRIAQLADAPSSERESVFWTALCLNMLFGIVGGFVFYLFGTVFLTNYFKVTASLGDELFGTLPWIATAVPLSIIGGVFTGTLEARGRFATVNSIQLFGTILLQAVPLAVAYYHGPGLGWLVPTVIVMRAISFLPLVVCTAQALPVTRAGRPNRKLVTSLFSYGAWVTVTNLISPLLEALDRMLIGSVLSASAMSYYSVPFNLANRAKILPLALARTLFPHLSAQSDQGAHDLSIHVVRGLGAVLTPLIVGGIFAMSPFLHLWVGAKFAINAASIGEIVLAGVWINSLAYIPFAYLQAQGRPDVVARFHLFELLPFIAILWFMLQWFGMTGAAVAWSLRVAVDALLLFWASGLAARSLSVIWPGALLVILSLIVTIWLPLPSLTSVCLGFLLTILAVSWSLRCEPRLRAWLSIFLRREVRANGNL